MKKKQHIKLSLIAIFAFLNIASGANLEITIKGIQNQSGTLSFALYSSEEDWLNKPLRKQQLQASEAKFEKYTFSLQDLEPGNYAVSVLHDVDNNGQLNSGAFGKPTEPYGFSNDIRGMFGPAKWKKAVFTVKEGDNKIALTIR